MVKRILVIKKHEDIAAAAMNRNFSMAQDTLESKLRPEGFRLDTSFPPVALKGRSTVFHSRPQVMGFNYNNINELQDPNVYIVRADVDDEEKFKNFVNKPQDEILRYAADVKITYQSSNNSKTYCGHDPVGNSEDVVKKLNIKEMGITGKNVRLAIVDTGINAKYLNIDVKKGWAPPGVSVKPGQTPVDHGTMCTFDARLSAPDAEIFDYALLQSTGGGWTGFLSDAVAAYANLIDLIQSEPNRPLVVSNSWGMFDTSDDMPIGDPGNYSANPSHPFNQMVVSLISAGADVIFAAGNCGEQCSDSRCGRNDIGPGHSIHGAQALAETTTIAAITVDNRRLGYSSQGPSGISPRKPDLAAYSHFKGSGVYPADGGTSAACPVAAGAIAAIRERISNSQVSPDALKAILQRTATDINKSGYDYDLGYGIINPQGILNTIQLR